MPSKRTLAIILGLGIVAACTLGTKRTILTSAVIPTVTAVATNTDADLLFVGDGAGRLVQTDPATGAIEGSYWFWGGANSNPVGMTSDGLDSSRIWAMHGDGYVVNWSAGPTLGPWFTVPNYDGLPRTYCDIDQSSDGDFYITTVEGGEAKLYRRDGGSNLWSTDLELGDDGCPRIAHDLYHDELYILLGDGHTLKHLDSNTMAELGTEFLDVDGGGLTDIDVWFNGMVGVGTSVSPWASYQMAWTYDPSTGDQDDYKILGGGQPSTVHITVNEAASKGEAIISAAGAWPVIGVLILD